MTHKNKAFRNLRYIYILFFIAILIAGGFIFLKIDNFKIFNSLKTKFLNNKQIVEQNQPEEKSVAIYCLVNKFEATKPENIATSTAVVLEEDRIIDRCFNINENGAAFKESPIISGGPFLVIYGLMSHNETKVGEQAIKQNVLNFISQLKKDLELVVQEFRIISFVGDDIEVLVFANWKIYFDASADFQQQLQNFKAILAKKGNPKEYIDLRFGNKVYFK